MARKAANKALQDARPTESICNMCTSFSMGMKTISVVALVLCIAGRSETMVTGNEMEMMDMTGDMNMKTETNVTGDMMAETNVTGDMMAEMNVTGDMMAEMNVTGDMMAETVTAAVMAVEEPNVNAAQVRRRGRVIAIIARRRCTFACVFRIALSGCRCLCGRRLCDEGEVCVRRRRRRFRCVGDPTFGL